MGQRWWSHSFYDVGDIYIKREGERILEGRNNSAPMLPSNMHYWRQAPSDGHVVVEQGSGIHRCRAEVGYAIARKYWGQGFATKAVTRALRIAFGELEGVKRIQALVLPENVASQRVLHKAGFVREGVLRNYVNIKGNIRDCILYGYVSPAWWLH